MNDNVSFLVEHGLPLEEIQSLLADGHSMEEIVTNARRMSTRKQAEPESEGDFKYGFLFDKKGMRPFGLCAYDSARRMPPGPPVLFVHGVGG